MQQQGVHGLPTHVKINGVAAGIDGLGSSPVSHHIHYRKRAEAQARHSGSQAECGWAERE